MYVLHSFTSRLILEWKPNKRRQQKYVSQTFGGDDITSNCNTPYSEDTIIKYSARQYLFCFRVNWLAITITNIIVVVIVIVIIAQNYARCNPPKHISHDDGHGKNCHKIIPPLCGNNKGILLKHPRYYNAERGMPPKTTQRWVIPVIYTCHFFFFYLFPPPPSISRKRFDADTRKSCCEPRSWIKPLLYDRLLEIKWRWKKKFKRNWKHWKNSQCLMFIV